MTTLKIFRGPPGSGKTTAARGLVEGGYSRVNRDDIRHSMFGKYWGVDESVVTVVEDAMIESSLRAGTNTVVDATNLSNKALKTKLSLASRYGAAVEYTDFPVPLETAILRDGGRPKQVGERVIRSFYKRYKINPDTGEMKAPPAPLPDFAKYVPDLSRPRAYIVDTDGTVANHEPHRGPYDSSKYHLDSAHQHVAEVVRALNNEGNFIIALSGRDEEFRDVTQQWWYEQGIPFDEFFMRPHGDKQMDAIVKYNLFNNMIGPRYNVLGAFDDRPQVLRMWETIGLPVFAVGPRTEF